MAQIAQHHPHVHLPTLGHHKGFLVAGLVALAALMAVVLVIAIGSNGGGGAVSTSAVDTSYTAGPAAGTPSALSLTLVPHARASGSLTTNVYELPRYEAGPSSGTAAAVSAATGAQTTGAPVKQKSLTTNVYPKTLPEAGPAAGTADAVSQALSGR